MNVLSIDLDFFLNPMPVYSKNRLSQIDYHPWPTSKVERYLKERCHLSKDNCVPGKIVTYHHEVFDLWKKLMNSGHLDVPFKLIHIDSHADMGMGDCSSSYIMAELLHFNPVERYEKISRCDGGGLKEGNFISFAIACRWISSLVYVRHPDLRNKENGQDIAEVLFRENQNSGFIQLKKVSPECNQPPFSREYKILELEPEVPIDIVGCHSFSTEDFFSFIFVSQSPNYTPETSDSLLNVFQQFIDQDAACFSKRKLYY